MKTELKYNTAKIKNKINKAITQKIVSTLKKELSNLDCKNHPNKSTIEISIKDGNPLITIKNVCCNKFKNIVSNKIKSIIPDK